MAMVQNQTRSYDRVFEIDFLRGICILLVLFDHFCYNLIMYPIAIDALSSLRVLAIDYWFWNVRTVVRYIVIAVFFLLSGTSSSFSKNNFARGVKTLFVAIMVSLGSIILAEFLDNPYLAIDFGIIHVYGFSILLFATAKKLPNLLLLALGGVLIYLATYISGLEIITTSKALLAFGITPVGYVFGDYFSLFPWMGYFLIGGVFGKMFYEKRQSLFFPRIQPRLTKPLLHLGRYSLFYYLGEQIVLVPIFAVLSYII